MAVATTGSLSGAARRLGEPLTNVSRQLSQLEAHVGVTLVERTTRRLNLTPEGRDYLQTCRRVLEELQSAESAIAGLSNALSGDISITAPVGLGRVHVLPVVAEFLSQDAVRMKPGAPAKIENWGGPPLPAVVDRIEPVARTKISALGVEEQRTNVILQFAKDAENPPQAHDFRIDARVVIDEARDAIRVPLGALFRRGDAWVLYKVVDDRAVLTPVEVAQADSRYRVVTSGVAEGDAVIVFPSAEITDGARVKARSTS